MRSISIVFFVCITVFVHAQEKYIYDTAKIFAGMKLIGRYPQFDKDKTFKELNFMISDPATIKKVIVSMPLGEEGPNTGQDPDFRICLVSEYKEVKTWIVNPDLNSAMYNGHTYAFDVAKIRPLAKQYPFDYRFEKIVFQTRELYDQYLEKQKSDPAFLFSYAPQFRYEGSFIVSFPRNEVFSSPKAISEYLSPRIERIVKKTEYSVSYSLNERNMKDQSQFAMTISGSKKLYDELQLEGLKKEAWEPNKEQGWFFYRVR